MGICISSPTNHEAEKTKSARHENNNDPDELRSIALESLRDWGVVQSKRAINVMEASAADLVRVQRCALEEYPFLGSVYESVLITDALQSDNPIVFVNDNFEKMTLYTREEVIGRNCRFLQGRYTDRKVVARVREACEKGQQLDVELLNYRKDGVPFWNRFLLLPVHCKNSKAKVTHFVAVQKDVTFLRKSESHSREWSAIEVALWLEALGLGKYGESFVSQKVDGERLLTKIDKESLMRLGVFDEVHQNVILKHVALFRDGLKMALYATLDEGIMALQPPAYQSLLSKVDNQKAVTPAELQKEFWVTQEQRHKVNELGIALKCVYQSTTTILLVRVNTTFDKLMERIHEHFKGPFELMLSLEHEGDELVLRNDQDLKNAFALAQGNTMSVHLKPSLKKRELKIETDLSEYEDDRKKKNHAE